ECRGADGSTLKTSGIATLEFSIDDQKFESPFLVLDNLTQDCIIGRIFMEANKINLDFGTNSVTINNQSYPLGKNSNKNDITSCNFMANKRMSFRQEKYTATLRENTKIKPMETQKLSCSASENTPEGKLYVVESIGEKAQIHTELGIAHGVIWIGPTRKHILMGTNMSDSTIRLPKGMPIAHLFPRIEDTALNYIDTSPQNDSNKNIKFDELDGQLNLLTMDWEQEKEPVEWPPKTELLRKHNDQLVKMLRRYENSFTDSDEQLTKANCEEYTIELTDKTPVSDSPLPCPLPMREKLRAHIRTMLAAGTIKHSLSPYASQAFLVMKDKGKNTRFVVNYKKLNDKIKSVKYPLPRIEEIMSIVAGKRFYTRLDARCAFHQIPVSLKSQPITAFTCVIGQFEFTVTPQGLKISPGIFQSFADKLFIGLHEFVLPYMDDYIIFSNKLEEHLKHIEKCFQRIEKSNIKLKRSKCLFAKRKIKFLGFVISLY
ncbi:MAG: hypothetical protein GY775_18825, partial [Candidatus Scalindua sp.]|nr:hypothetical protein [Candidatus Scalindua sp.]